MYSPQVCGKCWKAELVHQSELPVVIVGAGPYGLSLAAHLRAHRISFRIFGEPMSSWRKQMPKGMLLKSEGFASNIYDPEDSFTLARYCAEAGRPYNDIGDPVPLETFAAYGLEFQRRVVPELEPVDVTLIRRMPRGFSVTTAAGETLATRRIVIAAGITHFGYIPPVLSSQPREIVTHSSAHGELSGFRGRRVAVIGAGSSAVDMAALLHESGADVHLVARRGSIDFHEPSVEPRPLLQRIIAPRSGLGIGWRSRMCTDAPLLFRAMPERFRLRVVKRHLGPAPGWFMRDRVVGRFPIDLGAEIESLKAKDSRAHLAIRLQTGGSATIVVDHVIAATGYKAVVRQFPFLESSLRGQIKTADEAPVLNRHFESSVAGLYLVGLASANNFGPLMRFAYGARFTARRLAGHLAATLRVA